MRTAEDQMTVPTKLPCDPEKLREPHRFLAQRARIAEAQRMRQRAACPYRIHR